MARGIKPATEQDIANRVWNSTADSFRTLPVVSIYTVHPFAQGNLTTAGTSYSTALVSTADTYGAVETITVNPGHSGSFKEIELGLTCKVAVTGTTVPLVFIWQGRNAGGTYVDLHGTITHPAPGSAALEYTMSGYFAPTANFNQVPCDIRLMAQTGTGTAGTASGTSQTKNSSYVSITYIPDKD